MLFAMHLCRKLFLPAVPLTLSLVLLNACGGNSAPTLQSITVSQAALPEPTGSFQFVATGHYVDPSSVQTPLAVEAPLMQGWSFTGSGPQASGTPTLTQDGLARCGSAKGTFVVAAWAEKTGVANCQVVLPGGAPCGSINGTAEFTCE